MQPISSCREFFETINERFHPEKAQGIVATILYDLEGEDGGIWTVTVQDNTVWAEEGAVPNPNLTVKTKATDFVQIVNGDLNPMNAFMSGRIRGDNMNLAMKMIQFFNLA
jgi:putative sterol carrier protein